MPPKKVDTISINKLLTVVRRRKLAIGLPAVLMALAFAIYAYYLPSRYEAKALLTIAPEANALNVQTPTVEEQLVTVREIVLGRPLIEKVIGEFALYPPIGDAVEDVRSRVAVDVVSAKAFHVGFQAEDPQLAMRVANRLADLFVSKTASAQTRTIAQTSGLLEEGLQSLRGRQAGQNERIQNFEEKVGSALPEGDTALLRAYGTTQGSYQAVVAKENVASIADGPGATVSGLLFTVAEPARQPRTPYSPQRARIILIGLFAGLSFGGLIAFGAEQMNTSFLNAEEFSAFSRLQVLAEVPSISKVDGGRTNAERIVTVKQPSSVAAELYFTLAEKVRQRCLGKSPVILAVTSATGGEGKSLTSLNVSFALAKSFRGKVLLIDANLRRPMLHDYLELDRAGKKGFGELLLNPEDNIHEYIIEYNGLSVMPTFGRIANPLGMLSASSARTLLERISREFAFVVLDSPPIMPIADGHVLTNLADYVLLIARARRTPRELFKLATESLDCSTVIGVALNDVDLRHSRYSTAYRHSQENYQVKSR